MSGKDIENSPVSNPEAITSPGSSGSIQTGFDFNCEFQRNVILKTQAYIGSKFYGIPNYLGPGI